MTKMSQGNKKITTRKIPATNNKILVCTGKLMQPALFSLIPATNYKTLVRIGIATRGSLLL